MSNKVFYLCPLFGLICGCMNLTQPEVLETSQDDCPFCDCEDPVCYAKKFVFLLGQELAQSEQDDLNSSVWDIQKSLQLGVVTNSFYNSYDLGFKLGVMWYDCTWMPIMPRCKSWRTNETFAVGWSAGERERSVESSHDLFIALSDTNSWQNLKLDRTRYWSEGIMERASTMTCVRMDSMKSGTSSSQESNVCKGAECAIRNSDQDQIE